MTHTWTLILKIDRTYYRLTPLVPHPGVASRAWKLEQKSGTFYHVHLDRHGASCTCGDWNFRRRNTPQGCKHVEAMKALTLLEPTHETRQNPLPC